MAEKLKKAKVSDLTFDDKNFNKHTEYGMSLIEKSLRNNGAPAFEPSAFAPLRRDPNEITVNNSKKTVTRAAVSKIFTTFTT